MHLDGEVSGSLARAQLLMENVARQGLFDKGLLFLRDLGRNLGLQSPWVFLLLRLAFLLSFKHVELILELQEILLVILHELTFFEVLRERLLNPSLLSLKAFRVHFDFLPLHLLFGRGRLSGPFLTGRGSEERMNLGAVGEVYSRTLHVFLLHFGDFLEGPAVNVVEGVRNGFLDVLGLDFFPPKQLDNGVRDDLQIVLEDHGVADQLSLEVQIGTLVFDFLEFLLGHRRLRTPFLGRRSFGRVV